MEHIRQAVELARGRGGLAEQVPNVASPKISPQAAPPPVTRDHSKGRVQGSAEAVVLDPDHLESMRVVAHNIMDYRSKPYDILRAQVLRIMKAENWRLIAVTSPTPACGKTLTATNMALSIARQPEESALLVDMDLQKPRVASTLGIKCKNGLLGVLEGRATLSDAMVRTQVGNHQMSVLPCEAWTSQSSRWMASREMIDVIQRIRVDYAGQTAVLDLPPLLTGDEVLSILPHVDCVVLAVAVGKSTTSDIEQCKRHLQSAEVVRVVVNKAAGKGAEHYYY